MFKKIEITTNQIEVISDLFTNLSAGFFGSLFLFPGVLRFQTMADFYSLLLFNLPLAIFSLIVAIELKKQI